MLWPLRLFKWGKRHCFRYRLHCNSTGSEYIRKKTSGCCLWFAADDLCDEFRKRVSEAVSRRCPKDFTYPIHRKQFGPDSCDIRQNATADESNF